MARPTRSLSSPIGLLLLLSFWLATTAMAQSTPRAERIQRLRASAVAGDAESQYELSSELSIHDSELVEADKWLRAAAERGHPQAEYQLAMEMHATCHRAPGTCPPEMIDLLRRAADQGHVLATFMLGAFYREGLGVQPDAVMAFYVFKRAAELGYAGAAKELGVAYRDGIVVGVDLVESYKWFAIASRRWPVSPSPADAQPVYWRNQKEAAARLSPAELDEAETAVCRWLDNLEPPSQRPKPPAPVPEWISVLNPQLSDPCDSRR